MNIMKHNLVFYLWEIVYRMNFKGFIDEEEVFSVDLDISVEEWTEHLKRMFLYGCSYLSIPNTINIIRVKK